MKTITITAEVEKKLDPLFDPVFQNKEDMVMEKDGVPVAIVISITDDKEYEEYRRLLAKHILRKLGPQLAAEAERQGLTEEQLQAEIKADRAQIFEEVYGRKPQ